MRKVLVLSYSDTHDHPFGERTSIECLRIGITPDIFIHCGDGTNYGTPGEVERLGRELSFIAEMGCPIVYVPGNHDFLFERQPNLAETIMRDHVPDVYIPKPLEILNVNGLRILCNPYVTPCGNWAFCMDVGKFAQALDSVLDAPVDIVASHSPAYGIFDQVGAYHTGFKALRRFSEGFTSLFLCGHIHHAGGFSRKFGPDKNITFINCAGVPMLHTLRK